VRGLVALNNRRTGLAIVHAREVTVESSTFMGSRGQSPEAGVNCEPNPREEVRGVRFTGCWIKGNAGVGLYVHPGNGAAVSEVAVESSVIEGNALGVVAVGVKGFSLSGTRVAGHRARVQSAVALGEGTEDAILTGNWLQDNFRGIVSVGATGVEIRDNVIEGTGPQATAGAGEDGDGIVCRGSTAPLSAPCIVSNNRVRSCAGSGIVGLLATGLQIVDNVVEETGQRGLYLRAVTTSVVRRNQVSGSGREVPGRYDGIELAFASNDNLIHVNLVWLAPGMRNGIGIGPGCTGNRLVANVVQTAPERPAAPDEEAP
jgi:nitrous oxidase accessory protein NosD